MSKPRGYVLIRTEECKGCGLRVNACPPGCVKLGEALSAYGVHPASYTGDGCTGCGICFYVCPEPGAITVYRGVPAIAGRESVEALHTPPAN